MFETLDSMVKRLNGDSEFETVWKVEAGEAVEFKVKGLAFSVDWGDGCIENFDLGKNVNYKTELNAPASSKEHRIQRQRAALCVSETKRSAIGTSCHHVYEKSGEHTVSISDGITAFSMMDASKAAMLIDVKQWGSARWITMQRMFEKCVNMTMSATDSPRLSMVKKMDHMFAGCRNFNSSIQRWNTSKVESMFYMFDGATLFNQPLAKLNLRSVWQVIGMLHDTPALDQNLKGLERYDWSGANRLFGPGKSLADYNIENAKANIENAKANIENAKARAKAKAKAKAYIESLKASIEKMVQQRDSLNQKEAELLDEKIAEKEEYLQEYLQFHLFLSEMDLAAQPFIIDWGDGCVELIEGDSNGGIDSSILCSSHHYVNTGVYTVSIYPEYDGACADSASDVTSCITSFNFWFDGDSEKELHDKKQEEMRLAEIERQSATACP